MGTMHELNHLGDTKTQWNPDNEAECDAAESVFEDLKSKGFSIFRVDAEGGKGTLMQKFDPKAGKLIAVPRIVGG